MENLLINNTEYLAEESPVFTTSDQNYQRNVKSDNDGPIKDNNEAGGPIRDNGEAGGPIRDNGEAGGSMKDNGDVNGLMKDYDVVGRFMKEQGDGELSRKEQGDGEGDGNGSIIGQGEGVKPRNDQGDGEGSINERRYGDERSRTDQDDGEGSRKDHEEQGVKHGGSQGSGVWQITRCCANTRGRQMEPPSAWLALTAAFMINILIAVPESTLGIFYDYFIERYDTNRATVGWMMSAYLVSGCIIGKKAASHSNGRITWCGV